MPTSRGGCGPRLLAGLLWLWWGAALLLAGWQLFWPELELRPRGQLRLRPENRIPPVDLAELLKQIREQKPIPADPAWIPARLSGRWQYIVVHHSASFTGNAALIDRYHRNERKMEHGLAYHFVIGNGTGSDDGQVEIGPRWRDQLDGGHVHGDELNRVSIGVCLIGNFEQQAPSPKQLAALKGLLNFLLDKTQLTPEAVHSHRDMPEQKTLCPGHYLPLREILQYRLGP